MTRKNKLNRRQRHAIAVAQAGARRRTSEHMMQFLETFQCAIKTSAYRFSQYLSTVLKNTAKVSEIQKAVLTNEKNKS